MISDLTWDPWWSRTGYRRECVSEAERSVWRMLSPVERADWADPDSDYQCFVATEAACRYAWGYIMAGLVGLFIVLPPLMALWQIIFGRF